MVGCFAKKVNSWIIFLQKSCPTDFCLGSKYGSWQYSKKILPFKRYFSSYVKLFVFILIMLILFCHTFRRTCYRNKEKIEPSMFINWGTQFLIPADWTTENDLIQCVILEFFVKRRGFGFLFAAYCLDQTQ